jgi:hypothetical protein
MVTKGEGETAFFDLFGALVIFSPERSTSNGSLELREIRLEFTDGGIERCFERAEQFVHHLIDLSGVIRRGHVRGDEFQGLLYRLFELTEVEWGSTG